MNNEHAFSIPALASAAIAAVCALVGLILYVKGDSVDNRTVVCVVIAILAGVACWGMKFGNKTAGFTNLFPVAGALFLLLGIGFSAFSMANAVAVAFAGLNPMSTVMGYLYFVIIGIIGWLLYVVASFLGIIKD